MKLKKIEILSFVLVLATFVAAVLIYPYMPDKIVSHWGLNNQANGYMGRFWGVFLLPMIMLGCSVLFMVITRVDPKKENIQKFEKYFDMFILSFLLFFAYVYALMIFWNLGYHFILIQFMAPALAFLFYVAGVMISHAEPNWTIGIRTPWTLSSEDVWHKTHRLGGKLFKAVAIISLLEIVMPQYSVYIILFPILATVIYLFAYSYVEYHKK
ncbi:MAG: SdpI family protein [Candidatus Paceibacterota bacterium]|jgi:uncharacterized membrane protein